MKKIISYIVLITAVVMMFINISTCNINADMGSVDWDPYYGWVTNPDGVYFVSSTYPPQTIHIPYGARIYIWHGYYEKRYAENEQYLFRYEHNHLQINYWESINASDFRPLSKNPDVSLMDNTPLNLVAYKNVTVYEGPDNTYKKQKTIPEGSIITSDYNDGMWAHIYGEYEGWIYFKMDSNESPLPDCYILNDDSISSVTVTQSLDVSDYPKSETTDTISKNSEIKLEGYIPNSQGMGYYYISSKNGKGFIQDIEDCSIITNYNGLKAISLDTVPIFDGMDSGSSVISILDPGETVEILSSASNKNGNIQYKISYGSIVGWTDPESDRLISKKDKNSRTATLNKDTTVYSSLGLNESAGSIKKDETVEVIRSINTENGNYSYIRTDKTEGWVNNSDNIIKFPNSDNDAYKNIEVRKAPSIIWYFVIGAAITSVSSFVMIMYLNKKKVD